MNADDEWSSEIDDFDLERALSDDCMDPEFEAEVLAALGRPMLATDHRDRLMVESGISREVREARGYYTVNDSSRGRGMCIPVHTVDGLDGGVQWRYDDPPPGVGKYLNPVGKPISLDVHPFNREKLLDVDQELWILEGVKKGDWLTTQGICNVAIAGVWCWLGGAFYEWTLIPLQGRTVYIVFDSDLRTRPDLVDSMRALGSFLLRHGAAEVMYIIPPPGPGGVKQGVDDFGVAGGTVKQLRAMATTKAPDNEARRDAEVQRERDRRHARRIVDAEERPAAAAVQPVLLADLFTQEIVGPQYRVDELWPKDGKAVLTAPQKAGKTTVVGNLVRSVADGDLFLDAFDVERLAPGRRVVLIDFEMGRDKIHQWLFEQGIQNVDAVAVLFMRGAGTWDIRDDEVRAHWAQTLRDLACEVLIVDPLGPVLHGLGIEENSNTEVGGFLTKLDVLCAEAGVAEVLVVHHTGHAGERGRGASALLGWPDAIWSVVRAEGDELQAFIKAIGRDVDLAETAMSYDRATRRLRLGEGNRQQAAHHEYTAILNSILDGEPGMSSRNLGMALERKCGIGEPKARAAIKAAVADELIHIHEKIGQKIPHFSGPPCPDDLCHV